MQIPFLQNICTVPSLRCKLSHSRRFDVKWKRILWISFTVTVWTRGYVFNAKSHFSCNTIKYILFGDGFAFLCILGQTVYSKPPWNSVFCVSVDVLSSLWGNIWFPSSSWYVSVALRISYQTFLNDLVDIFVNSTGFCGENGGIL